MVQAILTRRSLLVVPFHAFCRALPSAHVVSVVVCLCVCACVHVCVLVTFYTVLKVDPFWWWLGVCLGYNLQGFES